MSRIVEVLGKILDFFYGHTKDYGIAIICLTIMVKLCLLPFQLYQRKQMEGTAVSPGSCLLVFLPIPIMIGLYHAVNTGIKAGTGTCLFPWLVSLTVRDPYAVLPILCVIIQILPQVYPYICFFKDLKLPKPQPGMLLVTMFMTLLICVSLPAGVNIYYMVSGLCSAAEQTVRYLLCIKQMKSVAA